MGAKNRKRFNQAQDTIRESDQNTRKYHIQESKELRYMYFPQPCQKGQNIFFLIIMWHKGKSVEQTAKICLDYFSPRGCFVFYMINIDI